MTKAEESVERPASVPPLSKLKQYPCGEANVDSDGRLVDRHVGNKKPVKRPPFYKEGGGYGY